MLSSVTKRLEVLVKAAQQREELYTQIADLKSKGKNYEQYLNDRSTESDSAAE